MKTFTVETGYGYFEQGGKIIDKAELPAGQHECNDDITYVEVADKAALAAVAVYKDPDETKEAADRAAIDAAVETLAIQQAKNDGHTFESVKFKDK